MSDTNTLMEKIMTKGMQLSDIYINSQYDEIANAESVFTDLIQDLSEEQKQLLIDGSVSTLDDYTDWLNRQDLTKGTIQELQQKIQEAAESYKLTSDVYKD